MTEIGKPDPSRPTRSRRRVLIPAVVATAALGIGWAVGRHIEVPIHTVLNRAAQRALRAFPIDASGERQPTVEDVGADFQAAVSKWNRYVISNGGKLPADPYRALLDMHFLSDPRVRDVGVLRVIEFARPLPPKLSPRLAENPHLPVFWWNQPWIAPDEVWVCYADGTWERRTTGCVDASAWRETLRRSGYPLDQWATWKARAAWMSKNQSR